MIAALARAGAGIAGRTEYVARGLTAARFLAGATSATRDGRLLRTSGAGSQPNLNGYLEDYAFLIDGLVALYEATFDGVCLDRGPAIWRTA